MADAFQIIPYKVRSAGTDVPPEEIQTAINSLAQQTQAALNSVATDPTGPAGGDLGGNYPNPTVTGSHINAGTINTATIGQTTPAAGSFTTLTATTPVAVTSGGTGANALSAHNVLIGEGSSAVGFAAPGTAGGMLISQGAAVDPAFANNPTITGGSINSTPVGATTPSTGAFTTLTATTPVGVASGGTGQPSLLLHGVMIGEGTAAIHTTAGTTGQMLIGATGADPAFGNTVSTLTATGTITPNSTAGIVGTTTNDSANAGSVGEFVTATVTGVSLPAAGTTTNITSISLTAGDWDVSAVVAITAGAGNTMSFPTQGISTTSATLGALGTYSQFGSTFGVAASNTAPTPIVRISIASTTTVFLVAQANNSPGASTGGGVIRARRVR